MSNKQKLSDIFDLLPLKMTQQLESFKQEDALYKTTIPVVNSNYIFGLEIEAEEIYKVGNHKHKSYWDFVTDNSLRNHGLEFVSKPIKAFQIEFALDQLKEMLKENKVLPEFTPRTSLHVHMNVRDLTLDQIFNLVLIYTSVENVLFNWVGHNRDKNIFCIKLTDTDYVTRYKNLLENPSQTIHNWNKYTALNLHPMESKGTVEFRHMYGTYDKEIILQWVNLLSCIKTYAKQKNTEYLYNEIQSLNTNSLYEEYLYNIFGKYTKFLTHNIFNLQNLIEDSITYVKLSTLVKSEVYQAFVRSRFTMPLVDWDVQPTTIVTVNVGIDTPTPAPQTAREENNSRPNTNRPPTIEERAAQRLAARNRLLNQN